MASTLAFGSIVCDNSISENTRKHFIFDKELKIVVKGVAQPLQVSVLLRENTQALSRAPAVGASSGEAQGNDAGSSLPKFDKGSLIGREADLDKVDQSLVQWLRLGQPKTILCTGESGCGKTAVGYYIESVLRDCEESESVIYW
jgi:DNA-binding NtrC family response regulator